MSVGPDVLLFTWTIVRVVPGTRMLCIDPSCVKREPLGDWPISRTLLMYLRVEVVIWDKFQAVVKTFKGTAFANGLSWGTYTRIGWVFETVSLTKGVVQRQIAQCLCRAQVARGREPLERTVKTASPEG
jgi:hypothetical protein